MEERLDNALVWCIVLPSFLFWLTWGLLGIAMQNQLGSMLQRQLDLSTTPAAALPLFVDEQYVVNLFNVWAPLDHSHTCRVVDRCHAAALPLFVDEQYIVNLFNVWAPSRSFSYMWYSRPVPRGSAAPVCG
jgi:hypothetical protein